MNYLVVFWTGTGVITTVCAFRNFPSTLKDIEEIQEDVKERLNLEKTPAVVNWLPLGE